MSKRQIAFGVICFLIGILVGMEMAATLDVIVRLVIIVVILLLLVYLALPSLSRWAPSSRAPAQRMSQRRTRRKP